MNFSRVLAISRRIASQFRRDRRSLALLLVAPIAILGLLGWVIRDQSLPEIRLALVNLDGPPGEVIRSTMENAARRDGITVSSVADEGAASRALGIGELDVAIILPASLAGDVTSGRPPTLKLLTPGIVPSDDAARIGRLQAVLRAALPNGGQVPTIARETIFGPADADFLDSLAPALIGFFGFFFVFVLTGISFLRERVGGTLERLLATPVRRSEIVVGYSAGFAFFATLQVAVILLFALGTARIPGIGPLPDLSVGLGIANAGSPWLAFLVVLLLAIGAVNLGIFLSTFARTELQILQFLPIVIVPQGLLGGVFWSISSLPDILQPVARVLPLTYAVDGLREVLIKGSDLGVAALQLDLVVLAGFAIVLVALAAGTIRREVA